MQHMLSHNQHKLTDSEFTEYTRKHDIHFNGGFHAAFLLIISSDHKEIFLVKHKLTENWMIPGGRIDMRGTGRRLTDDNDETPLQCALKEFEEETQQSAEELIKTKLTVQRDLSVYPNHKLRHIIGKVRKYHYDEEGKKIWIVWKYKIFYTVLTRFEAMYFESKFISHCDIETSEC
jgi:8-oxo-dGTP pyrophosphatase MutT (NUDIX family)